MTMSDDETMPLAGRGVAREGSHERISLRGAAQVFFAALVVFSVASLSARSIFPRGVSGRASSSTEMEAKMELASPPLRESQDYDDDVLSSLKPSHSTTVECTGDRSVPVVKGVDVVAYRSLEGGQPAVHGSEQYSAVFQDYLFFFSSIQNKMLFENDPTHYLPAWGGFCSYGVAHEIIWNADNLGPPSNPDYWLILDDKLYLFHSSVPMGKFSGHPQENVAHGTEVWLKWFGGVSATPFNTACFCTVETCVDA